MENRPKLFEHEQFGKIRVIMIDGEPWFVGKDVAVALGYSNERKALRDHVDAEDKRGEQIGTPYGVQNMIVINESGVYALIFSSKLEKARDFKHWVTAVVLPTIRKTGSYSLMTDCVSATSPVNARREAQLKPARVYALLMSDNSVKIGHSSKIRARVAKIERQTGLTVKCIYFSPEMSREDARLIEWACQKNFSSWRIKGEFFCVEFKTVCIAIEKFSASLLPVL